MFISYSFKEHYIEKHSISEEVLERYVYLGYFLKNSCLKVSFDKKNRRENPKDYTVNNVDFEWIFKRTRMLYEISIDIIFRKMLEYGEYKF